MDLTGIGIFLFFATLVERMTEWLFGSRPQFEPYMHWIAAVIGVLVSLAFQLDLVFFVARIQAPYPVAAWVVTGLVIGGGSNWLHDLLGRITTPAGGSAVVQQTTVTPQGNTSIGNVL